MRDLYKTLKLFDNEGPMDYCSEFDDVKSVLEYCNQYVRPLNKIQYRRSNEPYINEVVNRLQRLLLERHYIHEETREPLPLAKRILRKITMFLFANADVNYSYDLHVDTSIGHVFEICPLIPKFLLLTIMWELRMDNYAYEVLSYAPWWFTFQYFEVAADTLKHIDNAFDLMEKVKRFMETIIVNISRVDSWDGGNLLDKETILRKLCDCTMTFLRHFYTPDAEKISSFTEYLNCKYFSFAIKYLLDVIIQSFDIYEGKTDITSVPDIEVYEFGPLAKKKKASSPYRSDIVKKHLLTIIKTLLNSLQNYALQVDIQTYMCWVEIDFNENSNMQSAIGASAHYVCERIDAVPDFQHNIIQQLRAISIPPKSIEDTIKEATMGDVLRQLDAELTDDVKKMWFDELLNRSIALGNEECLEAIRDNIKFMSIENCKQLLDYIKIESESQALCQGSSVDDLKTDETSNSTDELRKKRAKIQKNSVHEDYDENARENENSSHDTNEDDDDDDDTDMGIPMLNELVTIIVQTLPQLPTEEIIKLIGYEIEQFGKNTFICCRSSADFLCRSNEFFNKFVESFDLHTFLVLCFEHPQEMWTKLFDSACASSVHIKNFCAIIQGSRPISDIYLKLLLSQTLDDNNKMKDKNFAQLLCNIYFVLRTTEMQSEFVEEFLSKKINRILDSNSFDGILTIVKALNLITSRGKTRTYSPLNFGDVTAPVLTMVGQIMEKARWDLLTYSDERQEIVSVCAQFIQNTSKVFVPVATEKDRKWISKVAKEYFRPTTKYYYQYLLKSPEPCIFDLNFKEFENKEKKDLEMLLISNFMRCTTKEVSLLARNPKLQPHISDVMITLGSVVADINNPCADNNYFHCMRSYAKIVIKFLLPKATEANNVDNIEELSMKVLNIIALSPVKIYKEIFLSFQWLLLEIISKIPTPIAKTTVESICTTVAAMEDCRGKEIFLEKFHKISIET